MLKSFIVNVKTSGGENDMQLQVSTCHLLGSMLLPWKCLLFLRP